MIPSDFHLSDTEKSNICYLAFPDSNSGECIRDGGGVIKSFDLGYLKKYSLGILNIVRTITTS